VVLRYGLQSRTVSQQTSATSALFGGREKKQGRPYRFWFV